MQRADANENPRVLHPDPLVSRALSRIGTVLKDKWRLDSLLGVGGMAAVYAATHRNNKRVALKMLHPELSGDSEIRSRFLREGYVANIVAHSGTVSVLDDDLTQDGLAFLVMELLEGETLEARWERKGRRLPLEETLQVTDWLLDVLAAAHGKSIVHRDIKPENLFITQQGVLKVLDFGIARVFELHQPSRSQTKAGTIMGTPSFMAPEQARGRWDEVDARTDLWAVGATMFTMLTGRNVHEAETGNEALIKSATTPAPSLASLVSDLPRSVVATVDRALAYDKEQRWLDSRSMQEAVRGALDAIRTKHTTSARPAAVSLPAIDTQPSAPPMAVPELGATQIQSHQANWTIERDAQSNELERLLPELAAVEQQWALAQKRTGEIQSQLAATQKERVDLDHWYERQAGTRTAAVEESRAEVRRRLIQLGERALGDKRAFGPEYDPTRQTIAELIRNAEARARDVAVHELALTAYDKKAFRRGIVAAIAGILLFLVLFSGAVAWRMHAASQGPASPAEVEPAK